LVFMNRQCSQFMLNRLSQPRWRLLSLVLVGIIAAGTTAIMFNGALPFLSQPTFAPEIIQPAYATGTLTGVSALASNNLVKAVGWYTVAFTTATAGTIKTVEITFPSNFDTHYSVFIMEQGLGTGSYSLSGSQKVIFTVTSPISVPAGTHVSILFGKVINA